jgi:MFS family permease
VRRPLIVLLSANAVSLTGNVLSMLAVPWFVLQTTGSPARTGLAACASTLPVVISATFAGTLIDRFGLRRSSVLSDLFSGVMVLTVPALYLTVGLSYGMLLVLLFARWLLATPGETARGALIPDLAARGRLTIERATAAYDGAYRGAKMVGAPLAGVLIVWLGPTDLLLIDGSTFLLSAALIRVGVPRPPDKGGDRDGYVDSLREGVAFLWNDRLLRSAVGMVLITNLLDTGLGQVLLPLYARDVAHDPRAYGLLVGAVGAGAVAGTVAYGMLGPRLPRRMTFALPDRRGAPHARAGDTRLARTRPRGHRRLGLRGGRDQSAARGGGVRAHPRPSPGARPRRDHRGRVRRDALRRSPRRIAHRTVRAGGGPRHLRRGLPPRLHPSVRRPGLARARSHSARPRPRPLGLTRHACVPTSGDALSSALSLVARGFEYH